jgi:N-acetylneuraminate synthase
MGSRITETLEPETILQWDMMEEADHVDYDVDLENWGVVVRFSDIADSDWGKPDVFEFRINGADLKVDIEKHLQDIEFDKVLGVHAPIKMGHELVNLSARDDAKRSHAVDIIQQTIDLTRDIIKPYFKSDSPYIVVHPGGITEDERDTNRIPAMNESLQQSMNELDDDGVSLLLENIPPLPWMWGGQYHHNNFLEAGEIADFCAEAGQKLCYDTSHAKLWCNYSGNDFEDHARTLAPHVQYLHVSDAAGIDAEGLQIGEGEIDFRILASVFSDFDGPIVTEIWRGHERDGRGFKKAAARLSEFF